MGSDSHEKSTTSTVFSSPGDSETKRRTYNLLEALQNVFIGHPLNVLISLAIILLSIAKISDSDTHFGYAKVSKASTGFGPNVNRELIIFSTTMFENTSTIRYTESIKSLENSHNLGFKVVICDSSPDEEVREGLKAAGAIVSKQQTTPATKGGALREALTLALRLSPPDTHSILAFQETEKLDMPLHWGRIRQEMEVQKADIAVPKRSEKYFRETYPIGQYFQESFGSQYLNSMAREQITMVGNVDTTGKSGLNRVTINSLRKHWKDLDWHFGPFAFRKEWADFWLQYDSDSWQAQMIPMIYAMRSGAKTISVEIDYRHSTQMKREEEGNPKYLQKRFEQTQSLLPSVSEAFISPVPDYTHEIRTRIEDAAKILA